jgi:GWxTD domain-containing protein
MRLSRSVRLIESCFIDAPVLVGYLRPVILMPLGCLANLPAGQIECILIHELSHIRRHDYLVNLLQAFVEGLLFYHPAVWWASRVAREERENCCDDLVVEITGDARVYAATLATLEHRRAQSLEAAIAATGGNLMKRIRRLLTAPQPAQPSATPAFAAGLLLVTFAAALAAWPTKPPARQAIPAVALQARMLESQAIEPQSSPPSAALDQSQIADSASAFRRWLNQYVRAGTAQQQRTTLLAFANPFAQSSAVPLTDKAKRDQLRTPYRKWLNEDVAYIITDEERAAFLRLQTDEEREIFIEQFWKRRDPTPDTLENEFREEYYRRIAYANEHFASGIPGWKTDRGRIYITYGPPDEIEDHPTGGSYQRPAAEGGGTTSTYPFQQWRYRNIDSIGDNIIIEFVDSTGKGEFHMTMDPSEKDALLHVPNAGLTILEQMGITDKTQRSNNSDGTHLAQPAAGQSPVARAAKVFQSDQDSRVTVATGVVSIGPASDSTRVAVSTDVLPAEPLIDYKIGDGDVLAVTISEDARFNGKYTAQSDGRITLPLLGDITAAGLTPVQLETAINQAALRYLQVAHATVQVKRVSLEHAIAATGSLGSGKLCGLIVDLGPAPGQYRISAQVLGANRQLVHFSSQRAQAPGPFFHWLSLPAGSYVMQVLIVDPSGASKSSETPFTVD